MAVRPHTAQKNCLSQVWDRPKILFPIYIYIYILGAVPTPERIFGEEDDDDDDDDDDNDNDDVELPIFRLAPNHENG